MDQPLRDVRADFSPSTALWCPWCRRPFIGSVNLADGAFLHAACGRAGALDIELVTALAAEGSNDAWFWERYLSRLRGEPSAASAADATAKEQPARAGSRTRSGRRRPRIGGARPSSSRLD